MTTPPRKAAVTAAKTETKPAATITPATYQTAIVAHTSRIQQATQLAHDTDAHIILDNGRLGCTRNHIAAWTWHTQTAHNATTAWGLVLEDDAMPIPEFADQTGLALAAASTPIVSLYLGKQRPPQYQPAIQAAVKDATDNDNAFIDAPRAYHCVATAIRREHIAPFLEIARLAHNSALDIDEAISEWLRYYGHRMSYTQPSLVDHRDETTIAKHRDSAPRAAGRKAWRVGPRETWNQNITVIP